MPNFNSTPKKASPSRLITLAIISFNAQLQTAYPAFSLQRDLTRRTITPRWWLRLNPTPVTMAFRRRLTHIPALRNVSSISQDAHSSAALILASQLVPITDSEDSPGNWPMHVGACTRLATGLALPYAVVSSSDSTSFPSYPYLALRRSSTQTTPFGIWMHLPLTTTPLLCHVLRYGPTESESSSGDRIIQVSFQEPS